MDKYDLRARGVANNPRNMHSLGKKCTSGKVKNLSGSCGSEKQGHESVNEISSCEGTKSVATESKCLNCEHLSSSECTKDNARDCGSLSSVISTSTSLTQNREICGGGSCAALSCFSRDENMKDGEVLKQSSISSDVSSETRQPLTEYSELVTGTNTHGPSVGEDGKQLKIEYSSSNSSCIILPASSNDSYQDASVDGKTCKFNKSSDMVTSTSADKKCSPVECEVKSSVLGGASEIGATDSDKVEKTDLLMSNLCKMKITKLPDQGNANSCYEVEDDALEVACRVAKEVEQDVYKEASESSSSVEEKNSETVDQSCADSVYPTRKDSLTESCRDKLCEVQVTNCHTKDTEDRKMSMKGKQLCVEVDDSAEDMGTKVTHESSNLTTKPEDKSCNGQTTDVSSIDLNEDFLGNETDYATQSVKGMESRHTQYVSKPVPVVATPGMSVCAPLCQTQGKPGGWRGSAATSAFRKTCFFKKCNGNDTDISKPSHVKGLDLNIAAAGCDFDEFLPDKCIETPSSLNFGKSSMDVCSTRVGRLDFDLNCASESNGVGQLSSPPSNPYARDFDLNDNLASRDPCNEAHQSGMQPLRNKASDFLGNSRQVDPNQAYLPDLSSLHSHSYSYSLGHARHYPVATPSPAEQMQRMVSLHHNAPPPHAFHYNNGLLFQPSNHHLPSPSPPMYSPYMTDPQMMGFPGAPHLMGIPGRHGAGDMATNFDLNVNSLENSSRGVVSRYHQYMEEQMRSFQHTFKRREPEGGWDSHQLGHRQVNPWR